MRQLVITSGNSKNFYQLKNFVDSLRINGEYDDEIAICDNTIEGKWDEPGTWSKKPSFTTEQLAYFETARADVLVLQDLIVESKLDEEVIKKIKSPTQRYPYKFIYNTLISKKYLNKVEKIIYFDSDIYFQDKVDTLLVEMDDEQITIVKESLKMKESYFLNKWLRYSDFSQLSTNEDYLNTMLNSDNFCSGMYGATAITFHRFNMMALLLTSNQFVNFYSDQPLINILKSYFKWPFKEIGFKYCLHLAELSRDLDYKIHDGKFTRDGVLPICVHFNGNKYFELEAALSNITLEVLKKESALKKIKRKIKKILGL